jgi:hypothetical protein
VKAPTPVRPGSTVRFVRGPSRRGSGRGADLHQPRRELVDPGQRGAVGDARGTTRTLNREAVDDYNYAAVPTYEPAVWMNVRDAADCPTVDAYRQSPA